MKNIYQHLAISLLFIAGISSIPAEEISDKHQLFFINQTENEVAKWIGITLQIEGYPADQYSWAVGESGCSDHGTREHWECPLNIYSLNNETQHVLAICETSVIDIGQVVIGELCDLSEIIEGESS